MNNINLEQSFNKLKTSLNTKSMLIETSVTQSRTVEIKLPFYSENHGTFYMITADQGTIRVYPSEGYCSLIVRTKEHSFQSDYRDAIAGNEISEGEFWKAHNKANEIMKQVYPIKAGAIQY